MGGHSRRPAFSCTGRVKGTGPCSRRAVHRPNASFGRKLDQTRPAFGATVAGSRSLNRRNISPEVNIQGASSIGRCTPLLSLDRVVLVPERAFWLMSFVQKRGVLRRSIPRSGQIADFVGAVCQEWQMSGIVINELRGDESFRAARFPSCEVVLAWFGQPIKADRIAEIITCEALTITTWP